MLMPDDDDGGTNRAYSLCCEYKHCHCQKMNLRLKQNKKEQKQNNNNKIIINKRIVLKKTLNFNEALWIIMNPSKLNLFCFDKKKQKQNKKKKRKNGNKTIWWLQWIEIVNYK